MQRRVFRGGAVESILGMIIGYKGFLLEVRQKTSRENEFDSTRVKLDLPMDYTQGDF